MVTLTCFWGMGGGQIQYSTENLERKKGIIFTCFVEKVFLKVLSFGLRKTPCQNKF